ncbi:MAG: hypothetical protein QM680_11000 [Luteolibacter sp.]
MKLFVLLIAGILFGAGLVISGMADPGKVTGFLDLAGNWDPALAFVMAGALATYGGGMLLWRKISGGKGWFGSELPSGGNDPVTKRLIIGAVIFGIGWGLAGFCPGPAIVSLGALRLEALVFVPTMLAGALIARFVFRAE